MKIAKKLESMVSIPMVVLSLWFLVMASALFTLINFQISEFQDQYFWFTLQNPPPQGGPLSYPFLAVYYFKLLRVISGDNILLFTQLAALISLVFFLAAFRILLELGIEKEKLLLLSAILLPVFSIIILRFDIIPIVLSLAACLFFMRGQRLEGWLFLIAGIFFKIFPIFFAPLFLLLELKKLDKEAILRLASISILCLSAVFLFQENLSAAVFQVNRGIQIESSYASILLIWNIVSPFGLGVEYAYGAMQLILPNSLQPLLILPFFIQALSAAAIAFLFFKDGTKEQDLPVYFFFISAVIVLTSKVFSTQFILWPLFFAIPLLNRASSWKAALPFFVLGCMSLNNSPPIWAGLMSMLPPAIIFVAIRNALLLGTLLWFIANRKRFR